MKKVIFAVIVLLLLSGCEEKTHDTYEKNESTMNDVYEKSMNSVNDAYEKSKNIIGNSYEQSIQAMNDAYEKNKDTMSESTKNMVKDLKDFTDKNMQKIPLDTIVSKIAGVGVPALVIVGIASTSGLAGGAAIVGAISTVSGGAGLIPGVVALGLIAVAGQAITVYGSEAVIKEVVKQLKEQGKTDDEIRETIQGYPISTSLKNDVLILLDK